MKQITFTFLLVFCSIYFTQAQCNSNELEVSILVETDAYGYEIYWELLPEGNDCGDNALFSGGNSDVGCTGGGNENQNPGGYPNNTSITEGPWCLAEGQDYVINSIDDWGDGGTEYTVTISGYPRFEFSSSTTDEVFTFTVNEPPALDVGIMSVSTALYVEVGAIEIKGHLMNYGTTSINSLELNYAIDDGDTITENVTDLNIASFSGYDFTHGTPWIPLEIGTYSLNVWVSNINAEVEDANVANNELATIITVVPQTPNIIPSYTSNSNTFTYNQVGSSSNELNTPTDLDFHPNGDLWVVNRETEESGGSTVTFENPAKPNQTSVYKQDGNAWHFMSLPSGIAFSNNGNFATSASVYDANHDGGDPFTGPTLWSSNPVIYSQPSGGNGSHLDMLHESPYSMGIASESDNVFWVFDGDSNDVVRYDFAEDHGPGNSDHSDGIIRRYKGMDLAYINTSIPCHLELDKNKEWLYIVDGGHNRVVRLNINTGNTPTNLIGTNEAVEEYSEVTGATWEIVVETGLEQPTGIDVIEDRMIVSDYSTGDIIVYNIASIPATEIARLQTNKTGITGVVIGPEGYIWHTNFEENTVTKIEPSQIIGISEKLNDLAVSIYPNPTKGKVIVKQTQFSAITSISLIDTKGSVLFLKENLSERTNTFDFSNYASGFYYLKLTDGQNTGVQKLVIE